MTEKILKLHKMKILTSKGIVDFEFTHELQSNELADLVSSIVFREYLRRNDKCKDGTFVDDPEIKGYDDPTDYALHHVGTAREQMAKWQTMRCVIPSMLGHNLRDGTYYISLDMLFTLVCWLHYPSHRCNYPYLPETNKYDSAEFRSWSLEKYARAKEQIKAWHDSLNDAWMFAVSKSE